MQYRKLGLSSLEVSRVGLGGNNFGSRIDEAATRRVVDKAIDLGVNFIDTADTYSNFGGSETCLGNILGPRRKTIVLATKFAKPMDAEGGLRGASRRYIMNAVEASLKRLKTDYIDLYQQHQLDAATPIEETLRALDDLVRTGKVRYLGCSNFPAVRIDEAQQTATRFSLASFVSCQDEYSLLVRKAERELLPAAERHAMSILPYYPLASGVLSGKYAAGAPAPKESRIANSPRLETRFMTESYMQTVERLRAFCTARHHSLLDLAIAWLASHRFIASVIAGATTPQQVEQNVRALEWQLTAAELTEVDRISATT